MKGNQGAVLLTINVSMTRRSLLVSMSAFHEASREFLVSLLLHLHLNDRFPSTTAKIPWLDKVMQHINLKRLALQKANP